MSERNDKRGEPDFFNDDELFGNDYDDMSFPGEEDFMSIGDQEETPPEPVSPPLSSRDYRSDYSSPTDIDLSALADIPDDHEDDIDDIIIQQSFENQRAMAGKRNVPDGVALVPDSTDYDGKTYNSDPGDHNRMRGFFYFGTLILLIMIIAGLFWAWYDPGDNTRELTTSGPTTVGSGSEIDTEDLRREEDDSTTSADDDDDVIVPADGTLVRYQIRTEGDIQAASLAYISGTGDNEAETGITQFPWSESVGMRDTVNPQLAVNSSGYGTLTCTILQDGEEIAEKTVSGEDPSVECIP